MATGGQPKTLQYTRRGLRMVGDQSSLFDLSEPVWHPDEKSPRCDLCSNPFTFTNRRHHCRRCGDVMCGNCSEKQPLSRMGFVDPVLVCRNCGPACKAEDDFFQHHLKLLLNGAYFQISDTEQIHNCSLSADHQKIVISNHEPLFLTSIMEIKSNTSHSPDGGGSRLSSLQLTHQREGRDQTISLSHSSEHSKKQSIDWLKGLRKGLMILHNKGGRNRSGSGTEVL